MSQITIKPSIASGKVMVPPSKSYTHRLLIAAALSNSDVEVKNVVLSNDIKATLNCLKTLGKTIDIVDGEYNQTIKITNSNTNCNTSSNIDLADELIFDCIESGSTLRFFIPIALLTGKKVTFIGSEKLLSRGLTVYENICLEQNIKYTKTLTSITFDGKLKSGIFEIPGNISSQFITGLLFALPLLDKDSTINITNVLESKNYLDITLDVFVASGRMSEPP